MRTHVVTTSPTAAPPLKRELGFWMATALVVGNMIGSGVFVLPAGLALVAIATGSSSLLAWAVTGAGAMLLAAVFATLGRAYPRTGGPYAYARKAFGDFIGFQTAWGYWIAAWVGNAAIAIAFVAYLAVFYPFLADGIDAALVAIGLVWLLTAVNIIGVRQSGWVQTATTVLKFVPLLAIGIIGLFSMHADHFTPFAPNGLGTGDGMIGGIGLAIGYTLWAFIGLESATVPAEEVKDPEKNIPRATIVGTLVTTLVYIVATVAIMGIIPIATLQNSASPFADAAGILFGGTLWAKVVALVALVSTFGALNGWILLQGRVPLAAAEDGLFPKAFGKVHGTRRTPVFALVASSVLITGLIAMNYTKSLVDQFLFVILLATLTTVVPYAFSAAAEIYLFITDRAAFPARRLVWDVVAATLAFGYSIWAMLAMGSDYVAKGFILLMLGIPVYVWVRWRRDQETRIPLRTEHIEVPDDLRSLDTVGTRSAS